ncbi:MAG TPA: hypothetical protein VHC18_05480 [Amycolatopsis sp.]|nr:hypothetical protein [Amycolatopsis sp.]
MIGEFQAMAPPDPPATAGDDDNPVVEQTLAFGTHRSRSFQPHNQLNSKLILTFSSNDAVISSVARI